MEDLIYKLEIIILLRKAVSQSYSSIVDSNSLIECVSLIDEFEEKLVGKIANNFNNFNDEKNS